MQRPQKEENQALAAHARKGQGRRNFGKKNTGEVSAPFQEQKKKDLSKVKCFNCHIFGHYYFQCPQKKRKEKQHASTIDFDEHLPQKKTKLDEVADEVRK